MGTEAFEVWSGAVLRWGRGALARPLPDSLVAPPQIQKLADGSAVISEVTKCSKIQISAGGAYSAPPDPLTDGEGARAAPAKSPTPSFHGSHCLTHYTVGNPTNDKFQMYAWSSYFSGFGERRKWTGDEGAEGAMPLPQNFWARNAPECGGMLLITL